MSATQTPWFVAEKRARKADQIARDLADHGITAEVAARLSDGERRDAERRAGIKNPGSDRTWRAVVAMLAGSHTAGALCQTCGIGDPEGVEGPRKPHGHDGTCSR